MNKKLLSELTVEEFEGILSKFTDKLIFGIKGYNSGTTTIPVQQFSYPWDDQNKVWCSSSEGKCNG